MTEKNYNPQQKEMMAMRKQERVVKPEKPKHEEKVIEKALEKTEEKNMEEKKEEKKEEKAEEKKIEEKKKERPKKTKVFVNATDVPISVKHSAAICYFIKRKKISDAIRELEQVAKKRIPLPMKGEIPHRKGDIMSGRYPQKAARHFIVLLKSLSSNCTFHGIEDPIITEAFANIGARPFGRGGIRRKRAHITIAAENKKTENKDKEKEKEKR